MLRTARSVLSVVGVASGLVLLGATVDSAVACGGGATTCVPETNGNTVTVTVTGSFVGGGSPGSPGVGSTVVSVPTPCTFFQAWTGQEYFEGIKDGSINGNISLHETNPDWKPYPGYQQHKDDNEGHWYAPVCSNVTDLPFDEFTAFVEDFFAAHRGVWVEAGGAPPVPPVPPEVLLMAAQEALTVPEPEFEYNPDAAGAFDTLVYLPTWFWLSDPAQGGNVTASAGGNSVTLDIELSDVIFSSPAAGAVPCDGTGTPWKAGAASDCVLSFDHAGPAEVTADTQWTVSWSYNGIPQGAVDPLSATFAQDLVVAESQTLVTGVS